MRTIPLEMCFKGSRDYLHGTDMFNSVTKALKNLVPARTVEGSSFYLNIHAIARHQCDMHLADDCSDPETKPSGTIVAQFGIQSPDAGIHGWLAETQRPVVRRVPYQEESIEAASRMAGRSIVHVGESPFTPVEVLVAITKVLHSALYPPSRGRWMLTKLEIGALPLSATIEGMRVELLHNLNNRITKSAFFNGSELSGHIYFSLVTA
ncbi:MAG: hypothetical protein IH606_23205 [Burkholderiales bacterium]|nr:hypothetical protein [Burkholderiales bacterium]